MKVLLLCVVCFLKELFSVSVLRSQANDIALEIIHMVFAIDQMLLFNMYPCQHVNASHLASFFGGGTIVWNSIVNMTIMIVLNSYDKM